MSATGAGPAQARVSGRRGLLARLRSLARRWRLAWGASLRLRVLVVTALVGIVALVLLTVSLSDRVRDALYDQRVSEALADAASRTALVQTQLDAAPAGTPAQMQTAASEIIKANQSPGSGAVGTLLRRSPSEAAGIPIDFTVGTSVALSSELRAAVQTTPVQQWQPVPVPGTDGTGPGIVVGAQLQIPDVGPYELYFVYSLAPEQATMRLIQQTVALAALGLLALLAAMALYLTRQVLGPVQHAARTAERLAAGRLDERMTVDGRDELATLGRSFNEMAASLQDQFERLNGLSKVQQRFVSDVSHELRTPLTTIRMASEMLFEARGGFDPGTRRSAELLNTQVDRFESLLADLLEISRFDAGAAVLDAEHLDVRVIARRAVDLAAPLAERMGTAITYDEPDQPCRADVDPRRVERILRNLLANAVEHAETNPIEVVVTPSESAVSVSVIDHGSGMTQRQTEQVFDRFWRGDPSRARTIGGTGLGLAISSEDARLHGGLLEAWGRPGVGATFRLTLPRRAGVIIDTAPGPLERSHEEVEPVPVHHGPSPAALPELGEL